MITRELLDVVEPTTDPLKAIAHDWHGFWERTDAGEWFKTPVSYCFEREITEAEANAYPISVSR